MGEAVETIAGIDGALVGARRGRPAGGGGRLWLPRLLIALAWAAAIAVLLVNDQRLAQWWYHCCGRGVQVNLTATVLTQLIKVHILTLAVLLLCLLDRRVRWGLFANAAVVMGLQSTVAELLKRGFGRLRPDASAQATIFYGPTWGDGEFGFPSGHATAAFALAGILSSYYPRWRYAFIIAAVAVCLARVHQGRHFFSDTMAGAVVGWYLAVAVVAWMRGRARRRRPTAEAAASLGADA